MTFECMFQPFNYLSFGGGSLSMAALTVEHAYASYEIGHLTVAEVLEY